MFFISIIRPLLLARKEVWIERIDLVKSRKENESLTPFSVDSCGMKLLRILEHFSESSFSTSLSKVSKQWFSLHTSAIGLFSYCFLFYSYFFLFSYFFSCIFSCFFFQQLLKTLISKITKKTLSCSHIPPLHNKIT